MQTSNLKKTGVKMLKLKRYESEIATFPGTVANMISTIGKVEES